MTEVIVEAAFYQEPGVETAEGRKINPVTVRFLVPEETHILSMIEKIEVLEKRVNAAGEVMERTRDREDVMAGLHNVTAEAAALGLMLQLRKEKTRLYDGILILLDELVPFTEKVAIEEHEEKEDRLWFRWASSQEVRNIVKVRLDALPTLSERVQAAILAGEDLLDVKLQRIHRTL